MNNEYKVYVSLQEGYITSINSEIFLSQEEMLTMTEIDPVSYTHLTLPTI